MSLAAGSGIVQRVRADGLNEDSEDFQIEMFAILDVEQSVVGPKNLKS